MIVAEIIPITSSILTESLSYFSATKINPGTLVTIPLRKKNIKGIVISTSSVKNLKQNLRQQNFKIRNIISVHKKTVFSAAYLKTIEQLRNYYLINTGKIINITYPKHVLENIELFYNTKINKNKACKKKLFQGTYGNRIKYYKKIISNNIKHHKSTQIICPTVDHCEKIFSTLSQFFNDNLYIIHSKISKTKLLKTYEVISTESSIIISTANFIDIPAKDKNTIILEKDTSSYYYRVVAPFIDLRIFVEQYAKNSQIDCVISDRILRPFRYYDSDSKPTDIEIFSKEKLSIINAHKIKPIKQTDSERILDITENKDFSPLLEKLTGHIETSIKNNERIFCYVQKKSLAPTIVCQDCGNIAISPESKTPYSLYVKTKSKTGISERVYLDKMTGTSIPAYDQCQFCSSWRLQSLGIGTDSVLRELQKIFPKTKILILDSFHIKTKKQLKTLLEEFDNNSNKSKILIGTQKAIPHLSNIDSSYIISLDSIFAQMSYTTDMRVLYLISEIYENTNSHTYVQSRNMLETNLPILKDYNYKQFIKYSLDQAKIFKTHPYGTVIKINHICKKTNYEKLHQLYSNRLSAYNPEIRTHAYTKRSFIEISVLLHIEKNLWNIDHQDQNISQLLPFGERDIHIEINPEVF